MTHALTRAGTIGPFAAIVEASGISVARLLRAADLPAAILERPDNLILLRDQFRLIEIAARVTGDDVLPLRLSIASGLDGLGPYGRHLTSFPDLKSAIIQGYKNYACQLQASTTMELKIDKNFAAWTYNVTAPLTVGRQKNELLALGYMLQILRWFLGTDWAPLYATLPGAVINRRHAEELLACPIERGSLASMVFSADRLDHLAPLHKPRGDWVAEHVPSASEIANVVQHIITLERLSGRYGIRAVAIRMGVPIRTLQRRLSKERASFAAIQRCADCSDAIKMLSCRQLSMTDIADRLGYSDPAHFSRAFKQWTGLSPSRWQRSDT